MTNIDSNYYTTTREREKDYYNYTRTHHKPIEKNLILTLSNLNNSYL